MLKLARFFKRGKSGPLYDVSKTIENELESVRTDIMELDIEFVLATSSGRWLDEWGDVFFMPRMQGESDAQYRSRIQSVATKPKNTIPAIISSVKNSIVVDDEDIKVYEPHTNMRKFSISTFSGPDKFPDATYYRPNVIDIQLPMYVPDSLKEAINKVKSAGVKVYFTFNGEIGAKQPVYMGCDENPIYEGEWSLLLLLVGSGTSGTGDQYTESVKSSILPDAMSVNSQQDELEVQMTGYIYKTATAGSLLTIESVENVKISESHLIMDDSQYGVEILIQSASQGGGFLSPYLPFGDLPYANPNAADEEFISPFMTEGNTSVAPQQQADNYILPFQIEEEE